MSICHVETNLVFLLVVRQDPLPRRACSAPTLGRFVLISKRNDICRSKEEEYEDLV